MNNYRNISTLKRQERFVSVSPPSKIMVVDDQPLSLLQAVDLVNYDGYDSIECMDSREVMELAFKYQPDVILMDIFMPEINGLEVAKRLKLQPQTKSIPIVLMSVTDEPNLWQQALKIGVEEVILKPLEYYYLHQKIKSLTKFCSKGFNPHK
ncbi:response regulator [Geminocystis herdmanii]|uniref:response regulator n=1 Tax=Geminocystis herdmanii TaxID=669359 RepID=UPI0003468BF8|nr:response regulator [Geminocystis herdmanii]